MIVGGLLASQSYAGEPVTTPTKTAVKAPACSPLTTDDYNVLFSYDTLRKQYFEGRWYVNGKRKCSQNEQTEYQAMQIKQAIDETNRVLKCIDAYAAGVTTETTKACDTFIEKLFSDADKSGALEKVLPRYKK